MSEASAHAAVLRSGGSPGDIRWVARRQGALWFIGNHRPTRQLKAQRHDHLDDRVAANVFPFPIGALVAAREYRECGNRLVSCRCLRPRPHGPRITVATVPCGSGWFLAFLDDFDVPQAYRPRAVTSGSLQNGSKNGCRQLAVAGGVLVEHGGHWGHMEENGESAGLQAVPRSPIPEAGNDFERE